MSIAKQSEDLLRQFHASRPAKRPRSLTAVELEREECAQLAERMGSPEIAAAIRERGA